MQSNEPALGPETQVYLTVLRLGVCTMREVEACLPGEGTVLACLHTLAVKGQLQVKSVTVNRKAGISALYWTKAGWKGNVWHLRDEMREKNPDTWARVDASKKTRKKKKPRERAGTKVLAALEVADRRPIDELTDATGYSYWTVRRALTEALDEGKVTRENEVYGRGRPRSLWSLVNGDSPVEDDDEVEELDYDS